MWVAVVRVSDVTMVVAGGGGDDVCARGGGDVCVQGSPVWEQ